jgi:hypothetical protein
MIKSSVVICLTFLSCFLANSQQWERHQDGTPADEYESYLVQAFRSPGMPPIFRSSYDTVLTEIGRWPWGLCRAVDTKGQCVYIGNGPTFQVLDITNPSSPSVVGEYLTDVDFIADIRVRDSLAFLAAGHLLILNVSNPPSIQFVGSLNLPPGLRFPPVRIALADSFAFVTLFPGQVLVVDVSDPTNPILRGVSVVGDRPHCLASKGHYAYAAGFADPWLFVIDASNPDTVTRNGVVIGGFPRSAFVQDTLLIVGTQAFTTGFRLLKIFSVACPDSPVFLGETESIGNGAFDEITSVTAEGNYAYFETYSPRVYSVDISSPTLPLLLSQISCRNPLPDVWAGQKVSSSEGTVFAAYAGTLWIVNATDPGSLSTRSYFPTGGTPFKLDVKDSLLFVASGPAGMWTIDVSNPSRPIGIANLDSLGLLVDVLVAESLAFVISSGYSPDDPLRGLRIVNVANPLQPALIGAYTGAPHNSAYSNSIAKMGDIIFMTQPGSDTTFVVVDVSNPNAPVRVGGFFSPYFPSDIAVKDSFTYLATQNGGVRIVDCRTPYLPVEVYSFQPSRSFYGVVARDSLVYADRADTIFVLDTRIPQSPIIIGKCGRSGGGGSVDLIISSGFLYWVGAGRLGVVDIRDPRNPLEIGTAGGGNGVAAKGDLVFLAEGPQGVSVLRNGLITSVRETEPRQVTDGFQLYQNYPNPFNPTTELGYQISKVSHVTLKIYDVLGRLIDVLVDQTQQPGQYHVVWHGPALSSGTYFCQLEVSGLRITRKMLMLR